MADNSTSEMVVQLFNDAVLGSSSTDAVSMLLPSEKPCWSPRQIVLDYRDGVCYGTMALYDRKGSFESLRAAINSNFGAHEVDIFAKDPSMGMWRIEEKQIVIQLSEDAQSDLYSAIYTFFVDPAVIGEKLDKLNCSHPELFAGFPLAEYSKSLQERSSNEAKSAPVVETKN